MGESDVSEIDIGIVRKTRVYYQSNAAKGVVLLRSYADGKSEVLLTTSVRESPNTHRHIVLQENPMREAFSQSRLMELTNPVVGDYKYEEEAINKAREYAIELGNEFLVRHIPDGIGTARRT